MYYSSLDDAWNSSMTHEINNYKNKKYIKNNEKFTNSQNKEIEKLIAENKSLKNKLEKEQKTEKPKLNLLDSIKNLINENRDVIVFILTGICIILIINILSEMVNPKSSPILPIPSIHQIMPKGFNPETVHRMAGGGINPYMVPYHPSMFNIVH